jgi:hypothetical protein
MCRFYASGLTDNEGIILNKEKTLDEWKQVIKRHIELEQGYDLSRTL